jgi:hypothetical protein
VQGWQEEPIWHGDDSPPDRDPTVTDSPSKLPAIVGIATIVAIVCAVIAIVVLHGGGEDGVAVPAPRQTTAPAASLDIDNQAARLSYRVPKTWTPMPDAAPEVLGVEFTGAASFGVYPCGGTEYSRAFAVSAAVQSSGNAELSPRATAERFATFWEFVGECLKPRGRVFFADDAYRTDGELVQGPDSPVIERRLEDGTRFRLVKVPHSAAGLERTLRELGWAVEVHETAGPFYWGAGTPL